MGWFFRKIIHSSILLLFILGISAVVSSAEPEKSFAVLSVAKNDRILILAPHPDDEVLAAGGIIQKAVDVGAQVKILYVTEGEHNPIALMMYEKKIPLKNKQRQFIQLGDIRRQESIEAAGVLGLDKQHLVFLDYPDSGTRKIFTGYWGEGNEYRDSLTGLCRVEERESMTLNAPYIGDAVLADIESVIKEFKPTKIFCSHPLDQHRDHIAAYLFLKIALLELQNEIQKPEIYLYVVHYRSWPVPAGFHPDKMLSLPNKIAKLDLTWFSSHLNLQEAEEKRQAIMKFRSQVAYSKNYLLSFARCNEIFSEDFKDIDLTDNSIYTLKGEREIKKSSFNCGNSRLNIDIDFLKHVSKMRGSDTTVYLFGYQKKKAFKDMPKIRIVIHSKKWFVYNQDHKISRQGVVLKSESGGLYLSIPLPLLGDPDMLFYSLKSNWFKTGINIWSCWRMINLKDCSSLQ